MHTTIIGTDLAKTVFQLHAEDAAGTVLWKKRLRREELEPFLAKQPPALIGMEACGSSHHWGRVIGELGHTVRLMHAKYVKRGKRDLRDAEAICETVQGPNMRFVPVKSVDQQLARSLERAHDLLVKQRTQLANAVRGLLAEQGIIAGVGPAGFARLAAKLDAGEAAIPRLLLVALKPLVEQWRALHASIEALEARITARAKSDERMRRLMVLGAANMARHAKAKPTEARAWLLGVMTRRPVKVAMVAQAAKNARTAWALLRSGEDYRATATA